MACRCLITSRICLFAGMLCFCCACFILFCFPSTTGHKNNRSTSDKATHFIPCSSKKIKGTLWKKKKNVEHCMTAENKRAGKESAAEMRSVGVSMCLYVCSSAPPSCLCESSKLRCYLLLPIINNAVQVWSHRAHLGAIRQHLGTAYPPQRLLSGSHTG